MIKTEGALTRAVPDPAPVLPLPPPLNIGFGAHYLNLYYTLFGGGYIYCCKCGYTDSFAGLQDHVAANAANAAPQVTPP